MEVRFRSLCLSIYVISIFHFFAVSYHTELNTEHFLTHAFPYLSGDVDSIVKVFYYYLLWNLLVEFIWVSFIQPCAMEYNITFGKCKYHCKVSPITMAKCWGIIWHEIAILYITITIQVTLQLQFKKFFIMKPQLSRLRCLILG